MTNISQSPYPPLLQRLKNHIENAVPLSSEDYAKALQPGALVYAAMTAGGLVRFRGKRLKGNSNYPLTHDAEAYQRAHDLTLWICTGLEQKLKLVSVAAAGNG
jgi:hypothetical protein